MEPTEEDLRDFYEWCRKQSIQKTRSQQERILRLQSTEGDGPLMVIPGDMLKYRGRRKDKTP